MARALTPTAPPPVRLAALACGMAGALLGGCTLVDQNTFYPGASAAPVIPPAPVAAVAPVPSGPQPLLVISPGAKAADYAGVLRKAVASARARKAAVVFDVVEMEAPDAPGDTVLGAAAASVARSIVAEGVPPARVRLDARPDASAVAKEVRVYVR